MPVSRRLRFEILRRDGHTCRYCGAKAPDVALTVDHVIPIALGGGDDPTNLVTACSDCNSGKASASPDDQLIADVDAAALLWQHAIHRATEQRRAELIYLDEVLTWFDTIWRSWFIKDRQDPHAEAGDPIPRDENWRDSIERFLAQGLEPADLQRLIEISMQSKAPIDNTWRYFCACCWNEIARRQELARRLIEDGEV